MKQSGLPRRLSDVEVPTLPKVLSQKEGGMGAPSLPAVLSPTTVVSTQLACKKSVPHHTKQVFAPFLCHPKSDADSAQEIQLTTRTEHLEENPRVQSVWCKNPRAGDSRYTNPDNTAGELESTRLQPLGKIDISKRGPDSEPAWRSR